MLLRTFEIPEDFQQNWLRMQIYWAVVMKTAVKVPIQKTSVYQTVTRQNAVILPPILFAVEIMTGHKNQVIDFLGAAKIRIYGVKSAA